MAPIPKCPACQSENLIDGQMEQGSPGFVVGKATVFSTPYRVSAYLCIDCGMLASYLDAKELDLLRQDQARKAKSK